MNVWVTRQFNQHRSSVIVVSILLAVSMAVLIAAAGGAIAQTDCDTTVPADGSIQAAVNAASPGDTICVQSGVYNQTVTITTDGLSLVSSGTAVIEREGSVGTGIHIDGAQDVTVDGFTVREFNLHQGVGINATDAPGVTIRNTLVRENRDGISVLRSDGATIANNTAAENGMDMSHNNPGDAGIVVRESHGVTIENNTVYQSRWGIWHRHGDDGVIRNNVVYDTGVDDNYISAGLRTNSGNGTVVEGNHVYANEENQIVVWAVNDSVVRNNLVDEGGRTSYAALDVRGGSLNATIESNEFFDVPQRAMYVRDGSNNATVQYNTVAGARTHAIQFSNSDGGSVIHNEFSYGEATAVRFYRSAGGLVENNTITHNDGVGIAFFGQTFVPAGDAVVRDNLLVNNTAGVSVRDAPNTLVEHNTITENRGNGVSVWTVDVDSEGVVIGENEIADNDGDGIRVGAIEAVTIRDAKIVDNAGDGIFLDDGAGLSIENVTILESAGTGIYASLSDESDDGISVTDSIVRYNDGGIVLRAPGHSNYLENVSIVDSAIQENAGFGVDLRAYPTDVAIHGNSIQHHDEGIRYDDFATVNATNNWWGDESGPSGEVADPETGTVADGTGDSVAENVAFDPWLDAAPHDQPPKADFSFEPPFPEPNEMIDFSDTSVHPDGLEIVDYEWTFGDDTSSTDQQPTHQYVEDGTYAVTLVVTDEVGLYSTAVVDVTVAEIPPGCDLVVTEGVTIQSVVDVADQGDVICIEDGTYPGGATIDVDGVTIRPADGHEPLLDGENDVDVALHVTASDVTIEGLELRRFAHAAVNATEATNFTLENATLTDNSYWASIVVHDSDGVTIRNTSFDGNSNTIRMESADGATVRDNTFVDNAEAVQILHSTGALIQNNTVIDHWRGFVLEESSNAVIGDNEVRDGSISSYANNFGVDVTGGKNVEIVGNEFDAIDSGIAVEDAMDVEITNNVLTDLDGRGIDLQGSTTTLVEGNTITDGDDFALFLRDAENTTVRNTTMTDNADGVFIRESSGTTIEYSEISGHDQSFWFYTSYPDTIIRQSNVFDNVDGMHLTGLPTDEIDARDIWWGDASGPSGDETDPRTGELADGDGDAIIENVRFDPWLDSPAVPVDLYAAFSFEPAAPEPGVEIAFDASNSSSLEGTVTEYRWDFTGDGSVDVTASDPETTWTYDDADAYEVTLEVEDDAGETAQSTRTVAVSEPEPSVVDYADEETDQVETDGLRDAIDDWRDGDVDTDLLRDVIDAWRSGEAVV